MSEICESELLLVGCGRMGIEHSQVLAGLGVHPLVVGRGEDSAVRFENATGIPALRGGLRSALDECSDLPPKAVVAVPVESLAEVTIHLVNNGVTDVLVEKPAGLGLSELLRVREAAAAAGSQVFVAYNQRFYSSVRKAREIIETDENAGTVVFDFTERGYLIAAADKSKEVLQNWFLANSTHVIDLAFHLAGEPANLEARVAGGLSWHPEGSRFVGIGTTAKNALFAYHADWEGPGGWSVEITTRKHRLILRPLEILKVQRLGSMTVEVSKLDDVLDRRFKPGVYRQMESFLGAQEGLLTLHQQIERVEGPLATMISGGKWPG